jgi:hypothetical protein
MRHQRARAELSEPRRKEVFRRLIIAQDLAMSVAESREMVRDRFGLTEGDVLRIEREGLERDWPPL